MKGYHFAYGSTQVELELPDSEQIVELKGHWEPSVEDIPKTLAQALEHPVHQLPLNQWLQPGDLMTLIISDMSRFWMRQDLVIPPLVDYMEQRCGIRPEDLVILVANGTHEGGSREDLETLVTKDVFEKIQVVNHDCKAPDLVRLGTTSRGTPVEINPMAMGRKVIALGAVAHHVMAGFGGGRKSILPGISSLETVRRNHALSLDPNAPRSNPAIGNGVLEGNPLHEDMCEAAAMVPQLYVINLIMNAEMKLSRIIAGHWLDSWLEGCEAADAIYRTPIPRKADVIIAGCGGYPKDMSLYQGTKTIDNVESGLKPGGTLVLLAECRDGGGPAEYFDWIGPLQRGTLDKDLRENFTIPGYIFYLNCEQAERYRILMLTSADPNQLAAMGIEAFSDIGQLMAQVDLTGKLTYVIENGSTVIPRVSE